MDEAEAIGLFNEEVEKRTFEEFVVLCAEQHKRACEHWEEGGIVESWKEGEGADYEQRRLSMV